MAKVPDRTEYRREWAKLALSDRRRIVRAVNRGQTLTNRKEAGLAVATARGQMRFWSKAWLLGPIGALFMVREGWQVYVVNAVLLTLVMGAMSWFWYRRAQRAERANLEAVSGKRTKRRQAGRKGRHTPG